MAEGINIPSPSVFLRASPPPPAPQEDQPRAPKYARTASATTKKAAPRKTAAADGTPKPKQSKSRNGCVTCKAKRLKCGEEKPACLQCAKRKVECGGYKKDFKWRPFEETNVKINIDRQKRASPPRQLQGDKSKSSSPTIENAPAPTSSTSRPLVLNREARSFSVDGTRAQLAELHLPQKFANQSAGSISPPTREQAISPIAELAEIDVQSSELPLSPLSRSSGSVPVAGMSSQSHTNESVGSVPGASGPLLGASPTLTEILMPFASEPMETHADYVPFTLPEDYQFPPLALLAHDPLLDEQEDFDDGEIERILRQEGRSAEDEQHILATQYNTPPSSRTSGSGSDGLHSPWNGPISYLYQQPMFPEDSPEMLSFRFDKLTCGILSVMDGPTENPWRTLIWPLALQSPALYHAVLAMTAFHSSLDVPRLRVVGHEHKHASIGFIQEGIRNHSMMGQTAIATALVLGFSESWDQHTATGNTHIKGAQVLVKHTLAEHQRNPLVGLELARLKFLCNAWVYMDVIARLTSVDSDDSNDFDNTFLFSSEAPQMVMGEAGLPGFGIDFGIGIDARLDPLMGCANTLFPLIGRVANLVKRVCRSMNTGPGIITQASDLKTMLEIWEPPNFIEPPEDPTSQVQHSIQTAEAYRWATLLHLHRSVPELPSLPASELAQKVLSYLATVPLASRTVIVQIYPLMVAGCEATTAEDRQWVRDRWTAMGVRMRIGVIDKAHTVTEEVWRRKDLYEAQPTGSRKLVKTSELNPVRQRGEPLKRTRSGFEDADPGRKGIGYSWVENEVVGDSSAKKKDDKEKFFPRRPTPTAPNIGKMDPAYTVRGHVHWVGVMWDWGWEILLG